MKKNEALFYKMLNEVFTGAKADGRGGFINLMSIKHRYYESVLERFRMDLARTGTHHLPSTEEMFDKLHTFFERYFSQSGSVYFTRSAYGQKTYERVYHDGEDMSLFWKTNMLYYVKSDVLYRNMDVTVKYLGHNHQFHFDAGNLENRQNGDKKKKLIYSLVSSEKHRHTLSVAYAENGVTTDFAGLARQTGTYESDIKEATKSFERQSEVDWFINKNAKAFLTEQLSLYLNQYLMHEENRFDQERLDQLKLFHEFAGKLIQFVSQFEDELVRVWEKPKFAKDSHYVVTLDRLSPATRDALARHTHWQNQVAEWQQLKMVGDDFSADDLSQRKYRHLPVDTKHFKDLEADILAEFDDLDAALDGRLIHSENWQALNTLCKKYKNQAQCIYIDPPFNLGTAGDFEYKVNYKNANWATMLSDRILLAHEWLNSTGSIFVRCDYNGNFIVRCLLDRIFGADNFRNEIAVKRGHVPKGNLNRLETAYDSLYNFCSDIDKAYFDCPTIFKENREWQELHLPMERSTYDLQVRKFFGRDLLPPKGRHWAMPQEAIDEKIRIDEIRIDSSKSYVDLNGDIVVGTPIGLESPYKKIQSDWLDIQGYSSSTEFSTENSEVLLERVIQSSSQGDDLVVDFFMGSGTTQAVAHKLGRKWLGVEMGAQFYSVVLPRMKQVLFGNTNGISPALKKAGSMKTGGFFKYYSLEQYEDTLRNMQYEDQPCVELSEQGVFARYIFDADRKFAEVIEAGKEDELNINLSRLYADIDLPETLANLTGCAIVKITADSVVLRDNSGKQSAVNINPRTTDEKLQFIKLLKPLLWWGE